MPRVLETSPSARSGPASPGSATHPLAPRAARAIDAVVVERAYWPLPARADGSRLHPHTRPAPPLQPAHAVARTPTPPTSSPPAPPAPRAPGGPKLRSRLPTQPLGSRDVARVAVGAGPRIVGIFVAVTVSRLGDLAARPVSSCPVRVWRRRSSKRHPGSASRPGYETSRWQWRHGRSPRRHLPQVRR